MAEGGGSMSKQVSLLSSPVINHLSIEDGVLMAFNPLLLCLSVLLRKKKKIEIMHVAR